MFDRTANGALATIPTSGVTAITIWIAVAAELTAVKLGALMLGKAAAPESQPPHLGALALGALGVVYGDIGTSTIYTIKTAVEWSGGAMTPEEAFGMFSLIVWTLIIITSIKYVAVIMRADNEGGEAFWR